MKKGEATPTKASNHEMAQLPAGAKPSQNQENLSYSEKLRQELREDWVRFKPEALNAMQIKRIPFKFLIYASFLLVCNQFLQPDGLNATMIVRSVWQGIAAAILTELILVMTRKAPHTEVREAVNEISLGLMITALAIGLLASLQTMIGYHNVILMDRPGVSFILLALFHYFMMKIARGGWIVLAALWAFGILMILRFASFQNYEDYLYIPLYLAFFALHGGSGKSKQMWLIGGVFTFLPAFGALTLFKNIFDQERHELYPFFMSLVLAAIAIYFWIVLSAIFKQNSAKRDAFLIWAGMGISLFAFQLVGLG